MRRTKIPFLVSKLLAWYPRHARDLPWRRSTDPYWVFVSEIMLQQTQVKTVLPYWERWMQHLPDVAALARASSDIIHKLWEGLGYYQRVRNMQRAAREISSRHGGIFPRDCETLQSLPGIGRYTAGAICSIAFDQPTPIVDGNVIRVLTRALGIAGNPRLGPVNRQLWAIAQELVSEADRQRQRIPATKRPCSSLNQALMELGALVCTPKNPRCADCPLVRICAAFCEERVDQLPQLPPRPAATPLRYFAFIAEHNGRYLVRRRPARSVNAHLWEFPNVEVRQRTSPAAAARALFGVRPRQVEPRQVIKHSITRYRITMEVFGIEGWGDAPPENGRWLTAAQLSRVALPSAHKKILMRLPLEPTRTMLPPIP